MTTPILTNKEGELYVWHKPEKPMASFESSHYVSARQEFEFAYNEACECAKAEAVKVINPEVFYISDDMGFIPGEDIPLPEGLEVEIVFQYLPGEFMEWRECSEKDWNGWFYLNQRRKVARIITKPVQRKCIEICGDAACIHEGCAFTRNAVEPIKEESQEYDIKSFLKRSGFGEYRICINQDGRGYIHPLGRNGETLDFEL
jgi:hypothetical protein